MTILVGIVRPEVKDTDAWKKLGNLTFYPIHDRMELSL